MVITIAPIGALLANSGINVTINEEHVVFADQTPVIIDGRTLVPVRGVFEHLGFVVSWDGDTQTAILVSNDYEVRITIGSYVFTSNGEEFMLDVPAQIINSRTMVPIRLPLESVGIEVDWDDATMTVIVYTPEFLTERAAQVEAERLATAAEAARLAAEAEAARLAQIEADRIAAEAAAEQERRDRQRAEREAREAYWASRPVVEERDSGSDSGGGQGDSWASDTQTQEPDRDNAAQNQLNQFLANFDLNQIEQILGTTFTVNPHQNVRISSAGAEQLSHHLILHGPLNLNLPENSFTDWLATGVEFSSTGDITLWLFGDEPHLLIDIGSGSDIVPPGDGIFGENDEYRETTRFFEFIPLN